MKKKSKKYPVSIRNWAEDDRPREKLLKYGEHALSNAELLAILIRTGTPGRSAVDIGRELLHKYKSLRFFDHIIIGDNSYFSFADEGLIEKYEMKAIQEL
jgi:DNA repair protein RadC